MKQDKNLPRKLIQELSEDNLSIFLFHGVISENISSVRNYTGKHICSDLFQRCMQKLSEVGHALSMDEVLHYLDKRQSFPKRSYVITFDDGFENNYSIAAPILIDLKIPSMIYITTKFINENYMSWIDRIEYAVESTDCKEIKLDFTPKTFPLNSNRNKIEFLKFIRSYVKGSYASNPNEFADLITNKLGVTVCESDHPLDKKMTWAQVKELDDSEFFSIGGHSHTHPILSFLDENELNYEIETSLELIKAKAGINTQHYSYPEGLSHCYSDMVIESLKKNGVFCCPTAIYGSNDIDSDPFHLKRILVA